MAVGRFVNGWDDKWTWEDLRGPAQQISSWRRSSTWNRWKFFVTRPGLAMSFRRGAFG